MKCPNCQTELSQDARFCGVCGTPVNTQPTYPREYPVQPSVQPQYPQQAPSGMPPQQTPPKKSRKALWITIIALVLAAAIAVGVVLIVNRDSISEAELREAKERFTPPANAVSVDLTRDDPSNENIKFEFDSRRRIASCTYSIDKTEYFQAYDYDDDAQKLEITTEYKKHPIETKVIGYSEVKRTGIIEPIDGYFVRLDNESIRTGSSKQTDAPSEEKTDAPTQALTEKPTEEPTQAPAETPDYTVLYKEFMNRTDFKYTGLCLLYLNDDDIPELVLVEGGRFRGTGDIHMVKLCWIENGEVKETQQEISTMHGEMYYNERGGIFNLAGYSGRASGVTFYEFNGSECKQLISCGAANTDTGTEYYLDGNPVSEEKYQEEMGKYDLKERIPEGALKDDADAYFAEFSQTQ